jgi:predicted GNAT family acetyltransferase
VTIVDNTSTHRFEAEQGGDRAELVYERTPHALVLIHTGVPDSMRGGGVGGELVRFAVADARRSGLRVIVKCPFAQAYLKRHPELLEGLT